MSNYEISTDEKAQRISKEVESLKQEIFEHRINIAKWSAFDGDYTAQIEMAEQAITNLTSAIDALADLS